MTLCAINPATGEVLATYDEMTPAAVGEIIAAVHEEFSDGVASPSPSGRRRCAGRERSCAPTRSSTRD